MTNIKKYLLVSLFAVLGACSGDDNNAVECADTCSTDATCNTSGDEGVCECNTGFTGDGLTCTADVVECAETCSTDATCNTTGAVGVCECNTGFMGDGVTCTANDICAGVSDCAAANISCTADDLVTCAADANGCLVETTVDCTATNEICDGDLAIPLCVPACTDDPACDTLSAGDAFCDGNTITSCETDLEGCLAPVAGMNCALDLCDSTGATPVCAANASGDSCAEPFLVLDDVVLTGTDITADFTDVESFDGTGCSNVSSSGSPVEAVFTVPLLAGQSVSIAEFAGVDIVLGILPACDGAGECYAGVDGSATGATEETGISYFATVDETVTVYASAYFDAPGTTDYDIRLTITECGDGVTEGPESCDDANAVDGDGCSACAVDLGFECDNTTLSVCSGPTDLGIFAAAEMIPDTVSTEVLANGDSFFYTITFSEDVVISGTLDAPGGEDLDIEFFDDTAASVFRSATTSGEAFADQLLVAGTYTIEVNAAAAIPAGWTLVMSTVAGPVCGDGIVGIGEACDDNMVDNDGCTACVVDVGYSCDNTNDPSVCTPTCGDGIVDVDDECDDGNLVNDDRCSDLCTLNADVLDLDGNDDFANAQAITAGQVARGSLDPNGVDVFDLYSITLVDASWVTLEQYNTVDSDLTNYDAPGLDNTLDCNSDLDVRIFDAAGDPTDNATAIAYDDFAGDGACGFLGPVTDGGDVLLPAGTYYVKVSEFGDNAAVPLYGLDFQLTAVLGAGDTCDTALDLCDLTALSCDGSTNTCLAAIFDRGNYELFASAFDLSDTSLTFTPAGDDFGIVGATTVAFPDTVGTGNVNTSTPTFTDDGSQSITTAFTFPFFGVDETTFFVNGNGHITFGAADGDFGESVADHFDTRRISFFFDDLSPQNGTVTFDEFTDHLTVTFAGVPPFNSADEINVQIQMFNTGVIVITYLTVTEDDCLVGISAGDAAGNAPTETDFSSFLP